MNDLFIDPITHQEVLGRARLAMDEVLAELDPDILEQMDWRDIAEQFYLNGYINGALETVNDSHFRETIELFNEEVEYQQQHSG